MNRTDVAEVVASFVANLEWESLPRKAINAAKLDLIDTLACAAAGRDAPGINELVEIHRQWGGLPESSVWYHALDLPSPAAALINGSMAHALEFDDTHDRAVLHAGVTVIPAALAAAQRKGGVSGTELLLAIVAGIEVASRLGLATLRGPGMTGWLLTPLCGTFGAAAAAARALGLDAKRTVHALGIAYAQAAGNGQATLDGALTKRMQAGFAARAGVLAAVLAERGITGAQEIFEGSRGYFHVYHGGEFDLAAINHRLGERFEVCELSYKPYPCCRWTHSAIDAALQLRRQGPALSEIDRVDVFVNQQAYNSTGTPADIKQAPKSIVDAQFSIPYVVAVALLNGQVELDDFSEAGIARPEVRALSRRVFVAPDGDASVASGRNVSPARISLHLMSGERLQATVATPIGSPGTSLPNDTVHKKFLACYARVGFAEPLAREHLRRLSTLEALEDIDSLFQGSKLEGDPIPHG